MRITILGCGYVGTALARNWPSSPMRCMCSRAPMPKGCGRRWRTAKWRCSAWLPPAPSDRHGEILLASERRLQACADGDRQVAILRLGAIYGPGRELAPRFRPLAGSTRAGDGASYTSWIHRDNVVGALAWAVASGLEGIVNLVDDEPLRVRELVERVLTAAGLEPLRWDPRAAPKRSPANRRIANRRLHSLGYQLRHPRLDPDA